MAFRACECHVKCAARPPFGESRVIATLLEIEIPDSKFLASLLQALVFLPSVAFLAVLAYDNVAHFSPPLGSDPLRDIIRETQHTTIVLDIVGIVLGLIVMFLELENVRFFAEHHEKHQRTELLLH